MPIVFIVMLLIVLVALGVCAVVAMGMQGAGRDRAPELANVLAKTARHLNGDADPPQALLHLIDPSVKDEDDIEADEAAPSVTDKVDASK